MVRLARAESHARRSRAHTHTRASLRRARARARRRPTRRGTASSACSRTRRRRTWASCPSSTSSSPSTASSSASSTRRSSTRSRRRGPGVFEVSRRATPRRASAPPQSEDRPLPCVVYNLKSRQTRSVTITPTRNWGGQGMLGVTIRFDTYHKADEHLVRVLEVAPGSPAEIAGLRAGTDYLLGTAERVFGDSDARRAASVRPGGRATRVASRAGPQRRVHAAPRQTRRVLRLQHGDRRGPRRRPPPDVLLGRRRLPRRRGRARLPPPPPREVSRVERRLHRARAARRAQRPRRHGRRRAAAAAAARGRPAAADRGPRRLRGGRRPAPAAAE